MQSLALRPKQKIWWLFFFCLLSMLGAVSIAVAAPHNIAARRLWIPSSGRFGPSGREASVRLVSAGLRTKIYVEESLWQTNVTGGLVAQLMKWLEVSLPAGAYQPNRGLIGLEEELFSPLPRRFTDSRLQIVFARLGPDGSNVDGYFGLFDQFPESDAWPRYGQHSNEGNFIYVNGFRHSEEYTAGVVAKELQRLLTAQLPSPTRSGWLSEALAEGTGLVSGFFVGQHHVTSYARSTESFPVVSPLPPQNGPIILFSAFLLDTLPKGPVTALSDLARSTLPDRPAVERLFLDRTGVPLNFDAIFSNFVSYVFAQSGESSSIPQGWEHSRGIKVPKIHSYFSFPKNSGQLVGTLVPYSFAAIDLAKELSPSAIIQLEKLPHTTSAPLGACDENASVLWKPVPPARIAVYAVGCEPKSPGEVVQFRLKILEPPSLLPASPLRILR